MQAGDQILGRYRLDARLGRGGMGEVWKGHDVGLERGVAVKVLLEFDAGDELLQRFRREASIGAGLQHPGITVVHDFGRHEDRLFIVMELLEGRDLAAVLAGAPGGLPVAEAVPLALQAAEALAAAHARQVVHRDLKPGNLFLLDDGRLKICDFGIARTAEATTGLTITGRPFGTPPYMAPEQWRGEQVDGRCDLYALGCVLYALLTGAPPFPATEQAWALMRRHLDEVPAPLRSVRADVPVELDRLVASLLAKDPAERPDTPDVVRRLRGLRQPAAHPAAPTLDLGTAPAPAPAAAAVVPIDRAPTAAATAFAPGAAPTDPAADPSAARRGPSRRALLLGGLTALAASGGTFLALRPTGGSGGSGGAAKGPRVGFVLDPGSGTRVDALAFGPDGRTVAGGCHDGAIRVWDLTTRTTTTVLSGSIGSVASVAFSPDGRSLVSCASESAVRLWDLASGAGTGTLLGQHESAVSAVAFSPDGRSVASGDRAVRLWDLASGSVTAVFTGHTDYVSSVAFSPDGKTLASGSGDTTVRLWDIPTRTATATLRCTDIVNAVAFSPDGKTLAGAGWDNSVRLWDVATRTAAGTLENGGGNVFEVAFSRDGGTVAGLLGNGEVQVWDTATRGATHALSPAANAENGSMALSPDGRTLVTSGGSEGALRVWQLPPGPQSTATPQAGA
ncbi:WD40 repeat domain-containing serine/threonine protein kinase [Kitasatospora sp. NPDC052868]|uniref:WD40 repeat domain-containing serine/threonine protein kinase n=1 Tax=Kitasatospora sp. NPDC052868 TaxID=3364060 RepID=UPI0037C8E76B